jgi:hypothetical protein
MNQSKTTFVVLALAVAAVFMSSIVLATTAEAQKKKLAEEKIKGPKRTRAGELAVRAPIAISGNNVYIAWSSNKTGNDEVMFRASTDNGVTFGNKINLSNTTEADSQDAEISASSNKVYVTW